MSAALQAVLRKLRKPRDLQAHQDLGRHAEPTAFAGHESLSKSPSPRRGAITPEGIRMRQQPRRPPLSFSESPRQSQTAMPGTPASEPVHHGREECRRRRAMLRANASHNNPTAGPHVPAAVPPDAMPPHDSPQHAASNLEQGSSQHERDLADICNRFNALGRPRSPSC